MNQNQSRKKQSLRIIPRILFAASAIVLFAAQVWPGDKSAKAAAARAQALALFQKALAVSDIRAPGSPPFELQGTIVVHGGGERDATGTYLLKWAAPDKWREEIRFTDFWQIRVGGKDQYWQARSEGFRFDLEAAWDNGLNFLPLLRYLAKPASMSDLKESKIQNKKVGGARANCLTLIGEQHRSRSEYCFDAEKSSLLSYGKTSPYYSQFLTYAGKLYPGKFRTNAILGQALEFNASSLGPLESSDPAQIEPPLNAEVWPACDSPDSLPRIIHEPVPIYPKSARKSGIRGTVLFYAVIGADGRVHGLKEIGSPDSLLANSAREAMEQWVYEPETCDRRLVPVETLLRAIFKLHLF